MDLLQMVVYIVLDLLQMVLYIVFAYVIFPSSLRIRFSYVYTDLERKKSVKPGLNGMWNTVRR